MFLRHIFIQTVLLGTIISSIAQSVTPKLIVQTGHSSSISELEVHPSSNIIATGGNDGKVLLWDIDALKQLNYFEGHHSPITSIAFNGDTLITSSKASGVLFHDIVSGKLIHKFNPSGEVKGLKCFDNQLWIVGDRVTSYNLEDKSTKHFDHLDLKKGSYNDIDISKTTSQIPLSSKTDKSVIVFSAKGNGEIQKRYKLKSVAVHFDSSGQYVYAAGISGKLRRWNQGKSNLSRFSIPSKKWIDGFLDSSFDSKYNFFAGANRDGKVYVYDNTKGELKYLLKGHEGEKVTQIQFTNDGKYLVSAGKDRSIVLWDLEDGNVAARLKGIGGIINSIDNYGEYLTTGDQNGKCRVFSIDDELYNYYNELTPSKFKKSLGWHYRIDKTAFGQDGLTVNLQSTLYKEKVKKGELYLKEKQFNYIWDLASNEIKNAKESFTLLNDTTINKYSIDTARVNASAFFKDKELLVTTENDAILHFYDNQNEETFRFIPVGEEDRIQMTPENYYWATKGALSGVGFSIGKKVYSFDQFDVLFNRPDKVLLASSDANSELVNHYERAYNKRISKLGLKEESLREDLTKIPVITIDKTRLPKSTKSNILEVDFIAKDEFDELKNLKVSINGVPLLLSDLVAVEGKVASSKLSLELSEGLNAIAISVVNNKGKESLKQEFSILNKAEVEKKIAYVVTFGVSAYEQSEFSLKYAHKDAQDLTNTFKKAKLFDEVKTLSFLNAETTKEKLKEAKQFISKAGVNDMVILFFAGHGLLDDQYNYYLAPFNIDFNNPSNKGIAYNDFQNLLTETKSRKKVLLLDACHSGEIDKDEIVKPIAEEEVVSEDIVFRNVGSAVAIEKGSSFELSKTLFADLRENNGAFVISSAGGAEYAIEGSEWNNGLFTYALINGLVKKKADLNGDKKVMMSELQKYIFKKVSELSKGKQVPTSRVENLKSNFRIW